MKRGQLKLSFGMIFSIILIIFFLALGFYAIKFVLDLDNSTKVVQFKDNLQESINKIWKGSQGSQEKEFLLPKKIEYVCFVDFSSPKRGAKSIFYNKLNQAFFGEENMFFYPIGSADGFDSTKLNNIDLNAITSNENPFCIKNEDGKIKMTIKKDYGENLVKIVR